MVLVSRAVLFCCCRAVLSRSYYWTGQCVRVALVVWPWKSSPCPLAAAALGELPEAVLESSPWWGGFRRAGELTNSATSQAQVPP